MAIDFTSIPGSSGITPRISLYVHRIGRTGRIGHRGTAMTYITYEDSVKCEQVDQQNPDIVSGSTSC